MVKLLLMFAPWIGLAGRRRLNAKIEADKRCSTFVLSTRQFITKPTFGERSDSPDRIAAANPEAERAIAACSKNVRHRIALRKQTRFPFIFVEKREDGCAI